MTIQLRHETPDDIAAIEAVTTAAFADAPHTSHTEQFIVRALRAANELTLSIVAEEHGQIVGHVAVPRHDHRRPRAKGGWLVRLGPISVLPQRQGHGIGSRLMEQALSELRAMQAAGCVLLGDPAYYGRFGFQAHAGLQLPGVPPGYSLRWPCMGQRRKRAPAMPSTPPPEPPRRRRRLIRLLALNTGRGHCRARILFHRAQDGTAWARC
jgi:putative acetyltransferase